jgi:hypothetical protein
VFEVLSEIRNPIGQRVKLFAEFVGRNVAK